MLPDYNQLFPFTYYVSHFALAKAWAKRDDDELVTVGSAWRGMAHAKRDPIDLKTVPVPPFDNFQSLPSHVNDIKIELR